MSQIKYEEIKDNNEIIQDSIFNFIISLIDYNDQFINNIKLLCKESQFNNLIIQFILFLLIIISFYCLFKIRIIS